MRLSAPSTPNSSLSSWRAPAGAPSSSCPTTRWGVWRPTTPWWAATRAPSWTSPSVRTTTTSSPAARRTASSKYGTYRTAASPKPSPNPSSTSSTTRGGSGSCCGIRRPSTSSSPPEVTTKSSSGTSVSRVRPTATPHRILPECRHWRGAREDRLSPGYSVQRLLQLGWIRTAHHLQGQEDSHHQPQDWRSRIGGCLSRRFEGDARHLPAARARVHHRLLEDVRAAVQLADAGRPQRADRHGRAGHVQRRHVPALRPRHEPGVPVRQGRFGDPLLRDNGRTALRPLHQHVSNAGPAARHRDDAEARLRRHLLRDLAVLPAEQFGAVSGDNDDGAPEVRALPGGPVSGHAGRHLGADGGRVDRGKRRGAGADIAEGRVQTARVEGDDHGVEAQHAGQGEGGQDAEPDASFGQDAAGVRRRDQEAEGDDRQAREPDPGAGGGSGVGQGQRRRGRLGRRRIERRTRPRG